jgi:chromosome segregation ATPase
VADGSNVALLAGTLSSLALGAGALWRSSRQDTRQAEQVKTDAAVASLQKQVDMLLRQQEASLRSETALRAELDTERQQRAESEARLRAEIRALSEKYESCEHDRTDLIRQLSSVNGELATTKGELADARSRLANGYGDPS